MNGSATTTLVFTPWNWARSQEVVVTAVDDEEPEGDHTGVVTHTVSGGGYDHVAPMVLVVDIGDNDLVAIDALSFNVEEGGRLSYTIGLAQEPTGDVFVLVTVDDQLRLDYYDTSVLLMFSRQDWNVPLVVWVDAFDDPYVEGDHFGTITHEFSGGGYDGLVRQTTIHITDNDIPAVVINESGGTTEVTEGGAGDSYTVALGAPPPPGVEVVVTATACEQVRVNGAVATTLTFTAADWNVAQTVVVSGVDDLLVEGLHTGTVTHAVSGGAFTSTVVPAVTVWVTDNDGLAGDFDGDGRLGLRDLVALSRRLGLSSGQPGWSPAYDLVPDGVIDQRDLALLTGMIRSRSSP